MKGYIPTKNYQSFVNHIYNVGKITYEVDKTYAVATDQYILGFQFYQNMEDVLNHFEYGDDFILLEVETLGKTLIEGNTGFTDCIAIIRVIPSDEYTFTIPDLTSDPITNYDS